MAEGGGYLQGVGLFRSAPPSLPSQGGVSRGFVEDIEDATTGTTLPFYLASTSCLGYACYLDFGGRVWYVIGRRSDLHGCHFHGFRSMLIKTSSGPWPRFSHYCSTTKLYLSAICKCGFTTLSARLYPSSASFTFFASNPSITLHAVGLITPPSTHLFTFPQNASLTSA